MTRVQTWLTEKAPGIAVLFRIGTAACSLDNLRASLTTNEDTLVQGDEKGSYRLEEVLEFLTWSLTPASELGFTVCVVLDWFAPHLRDEVDALCHKLGHCVLRIGGGLTPWVQVGDTHAHRPYNQHYRDFEKAAACSQWEERPGSLLECSRQNVLDRSVDAWNCVDHAKNVEGWRHNGITNPLDGTDDQLGSHVRLLWQELNMDALRRQLIKDVEEAVGSGEITSFSQYPDLLLPYDDHPPLADGLGSMPTCVYDEDGAHVDVCTGELLGNGDVSDDDAADATIAQESKAFEGNEGALQAASGSELPLHPPDFQPTTSDMRLAASPSALQAASDGELPFEPPPRRPPRLHPSPLRCVACRQSNRLAGRSRG